MSGEQSLTPIEQRTVQFYDDDIMAVRLGDGRIMVPVRPLTNALGLTWQGQNERINRDPILNEVAMSISVTLTDIDPGSKRPRTSAMKCLPLEYLNGWLFGINANRVKEEIRPRVLRYQRECYKVLHEAFQEGRLSINQATDILAGANPETVEAYQLALAVVKLARSQMQIEARLTDHDAALNEYSTRLEAIEAQLGDRSGEVTEDQASQISQSVKAVALAYGKKTGKNQFGAVYGEMYRKFGITSYKLLPAKKFKDCMAWLTDWHQSLTDELPF